ncbi:MAG: zinc-finger domain-containing protein [Hyphomicrobiaceae bacterium]|nr:zinc-finger domain-containing protein [Hyphomicrobiaceae bacterium]
MADAPIPHFHNTDGHTAIAVGSREFMCIGARPPYDHPHIFLDLGSDDEKICPYCSTLYKFDARLAAGTAEPASALWNDAA